MTIIATYNNFESANEALETLMEAGISRGNISVAALEETSKQINTEGMNIADSNNPIGDVVGGTTGGILSGAGLGGIIGLLTGVAALTIPGFGALLITGPLAAALGFSSLAANTVAGAAIGGTAAGVVGLASGLVKAGVDATQADMIQSTVQSGGVMLAVEDNEQIAENILNESNPNTIVIL